MKKFFQSIAAVVGSMFAPIVALAQFNNTNTSTGVEAVDILDDIKEILDTVIPILVTLGVVFLIWGVVSYITAKEEDKKKEARGMMINGAIGLFFILAIWGIIGLISSTFGIGVGGNINSNTMIPGVI
jgi:uncharacterized membrane protein HdeD (DUF308 family)